MTIDLAQYGVSAPTGTTQEPGFKGSTVFGVGLLSAALAGAFVYGMTAAKHEEELVRVRRSPRCNRPRPRVRPAYANKVGWHWDGCGWRGPNGERPPRKKR